MAVIDFSNAVAQVAGTAHTIQKPYVILNDCYICSQDGTIISSDVTISIIDIYPKFQASISGTMSTNGTEFYIYAKNGSSANTTYGYKISNISFQSGDNFSFNVSAEIVPYNYPPTDFNVRANIKITDNPNNGLNVHANIKIIDNPNNGLHTCANIKIKNN